MYMDRYFEKITILETLGIYVLINILVFLSTLVINVDSKSAINKNLLVIISEILLITYIIYRLSHNNFKLKEAIRSEEHTSELQSRQYLVCRLLLEKKKKN